MSRHERVWYTPQEVGNLAGGVTAEFIRREIKAGEIPASLIVSSRGKLGRWRIHKDDANAYVKRMVRTAPTPITPTAENPSAV